MLLNGCEEDERRKGSTLGGCEGAERRKGLYTPLTAICWIHVSR